MALAMAATGLTLVGLTLPLVGWQTWLDWLAVGRLAATGYARDDTWIILSRDVQGAVRRFFMQEPTARLPTALATSCWTAVAAVTVAVALLRRQPVRAEDGPGAAFVLLGAWLSCFHFMYYDTLLAALPLLLLFTPARGNKVVPFAVLVLLIGLYYGSTTLRPDYRFPPSDTYLLLGLWAWCGWELLRGEPRTTTAPHDRSLPPVA
jgi:hypothetical protein